MRRFEIANFPSTERFVRAHWAPVLLRPILGSPEQVVIGVAAVNGASNLVRLECLLDGDAAAAILAANAGMDALDADSAVRSGEALSDYRAVFSGVRIGNLREAEGESVKSIAQSWLTALSSLAVREKRPVTPMKAAPDGTAPSAQRDRLPLLVLDYVRSKRPDVDKFFSREIREQKPESNNASAVKIDYSGSKIVANFGSLLVSQHKRSVLRITKSLWDLKVDRDGENGWAKRDHEMIVQHPRLNDPQFTQKQLDMMGEALAQLEKQADQEEIRLRPMNSVPQIGDHILQREAA
jgi:hypothetical protein